MDVLCNNAGVFVGGFLWERTSADHEFVLGVNVWGILNGIRAFVPRMLEGGAEGHIVNTCSVAGLLAHPVCGPYGLSKFAAFAATEALALDLALIGSKIKVTALCPGMVRTNLGTSSQETRPAELATNLTEDAQLAHETLGQYMDEGIDPDDVADRVLGAIRDEQFLVLTHPHHVAALRRRTEQLADGLLPDPADYR